MHYLVQFAGPVFPEISTNELVITGTILVFIFYFICFLLPAVLISMAFIAIAKIPKPNRKVVYRHLEVAFSAMFLTFFGFAYLEWITNGIPLFPLFGLIWFLYWQKLFKNYIDR